MKKLILAVVMTAITWCCLPNSYGQTQPSKEPKVIVDEFFKAFSEGKFEDAMIAFLKTNPWTEKKPDMIESLRPKYAGLPSVAGKYIGFKVIKTEEAENAIRIKVAAYFDRQPLLITFTFYKSAGVWRGQDIDVNFDDAFDEILKSEAK